MMSGDRPCVTCQWCLEIARNQFQICQPYLCRNPKVGRDPVTGLLRFSWCDAQRNGGPTAEPDYRCAGQWWEAQPVVEVPVSPWLAGWLRRMWRG
jgi:hypothetical protein